jgi:hypothetical protein
MHAINVKDGYIESIVAGVGTANSNATEAEYLAVKAIMENAPNAPDGYYYRLTETLEWELDQFPEIPEPEATEADYLEKLEQLGVAVNA